jgi:hypothetical protein
MNSATLDAGALPHMPIGRVLRVYFTDAKFEALRMLRAPAFAIPFLVIPAPIYLLFGVVMAAQSAAKSPGIYNYLRGKVGGQDQLLESAAAGADRHPGTGCFAVLCTGVVHRRPFQR